MDLAKPRDNQFLFLDMNAFFASCEQHKNPALRGKPVGVTPTLTEGGTLIAASYEAKKRGVTTYTKVGEAYRMIPDITIIKGDHTYYTAIHQRLAQFLSQEISPDAIKLSVDEFAIPLDSRERWTPNAHALALFIKKRIREIFSPALRCSIGIGPNLFLAKLGTEVQKPDGLVVIQHHTLEQAFSQLKLRDIPGINWGLTYKFLSLGIRTPLELYHQSRSFLHDALGIGGDAWWYRLHGYTVTTKQTVTQSISHSHVLAPELRTKAKARSVLYKLFYKVAERLRDKQLETNHVWIGVRSKDGWWEHHVQIGTTFSLFTTFEAIGRAYDTTYPTSKAPVQIRVVASLLGRNTAMSLFDQPQETRRINLFKAIDTINHEFGRWTIKPASLLSIQTSAPNRITFHAPDYAMDT